MSKPVVVIRKVEDSPDWLDRRLVVAYLRTSYIVHLLDIPPIRIGEPNPAFECWLEQCGHTSYTFITASNPGSVMLAPGQNRRRNALLEADLKKASRFLLGGLGLGDSGEWPGEASWLALDIAGDDAIRLGRQYGQNAIVRWEKGGVAELWWL